MRHPYNHKNQFIALTILAFLFTTCYQEEVITEEVVIEVEAGEGLDDWSSETHTTAGSPNYDLVFPQDKVNRLDIVISSDYWEDMLEDMEDNLGNFGSGSSGPGRNSSLTTESTSETNTDLDFTPVFKPASIFLNSNN